MLVCEQKAINRAEGGRKREQWMEMERERLVHGGRERQGERGEEKGE